MAAFFEKEVNWDSGKRALTVGFPTDGAEGGDEILEGEIDW
ncbi:hypothetical protein N9Z45_02055 [Akkermansiaceae bacterium]|nr:hypothetical protein [Akkermansiaceae bacterium]MDB4319627.1 hypothetical protein [bacterium]MDB4393132.1 hypothetical protein [Akkermansiaceae bacterium]MDC0287386.1 hypothetical protein [Akkermansiaceae bacterium]